MGFRLNRHMQSLEASVKEGKLYIYFKDEIFKELDLGIPKNITFDKQCNFIKTIFNKVSCFLTNSKYKLIIRFGGTTDLLTLNNILLRRYNTSTELLECDNIFPNLCGSLKIDKHFYPLNIFSLTDDKFILCSDLIPITLQLSLNSELSKFIIKASKSQDNLALIFDDMQTRGKKYSLDCGTGRYQIVEEITGIQKDGFIGAVL